MHLVQVFGTFLSYVVMMVLVLLLLLISKLVVKDPTQGDESTKVMSITRSSFVTHGRGCLLLLLLTNVVMVRRLLLVVMLISGVHLLVVVVMEVVLVVVWASVGQGSRPQRGTGGT